MRTRGARQGLQAAGGEEPAQAVEQVVRRAIQILIAAEFAGQALAFLERGEGVVVAAHLVEQPSFLRQFVRPEASVAGLLGQLVQHRQRLIVALHPAQQHRARQQQAGIVRPQLFHPVEDLGGGVELAVGFLQPRPAEQGLADLRRGGDGFPVEGAAFLHPALVLQVPGQVGEQDRIAAAAEFENLAIVVFADRGPLRLGQDHAHQVVRLRVLRRDADGVAGLDLGFLDGALAQQQQREFVGGGEVVGVERDDTADQRLGRGVFPLVLADLVQHGQRTGTIRGEFQHIQAQAFRGLDGALAVRGDGAFHQRHQVARGFRRRHRGRVHGAAAGGAKPAAAGAHLEGWL